MTDPDERIINKALAYVGDDRFRDHGKTVYELQDLREEARAALHRLFRDRRRLENELAEAAGREMRLVMENEDMKAELTELRKAVRRLREVDADPHSTPKDNEWAWNALMRLIEEKP